MTFWLQNYFLTFCDTWAKFDDFFVKKNTLATFYDTQALGNIE